MEKVLIFNVGHQTVLKVKIDFSENRAEVLEIGDEATLGLLLAPENRNFEGLLALFEQITSEQVPLAKYIESIQKNGFYYSDKVHLGITVACVDKEESI